MDDEDEERLYINTIREESKKENTLEIAHNMLKKSYDVNEIADVTNLSIDEIEKLK